MRKINNRGLLYDWIIIVCFIFIFGAVYVGLDNFMDNDFPSMASDVNASEDTVEVISTTWNTLPYVAGFSMIIYGLFMASTRREGDSRIDYY